MAIVLSIAAIILSIVWSVIGPIQDQSRQQQAVEELNQIVPGVRAYLANQTNMGLQGSYAAFTGKLITNQIIPPFMVSTPCSTSVPSSCVNGPWGSGTGTGTLWVCNWQMGGGSTNCTTAPASTGNQTFAIEFNNLTNASCTALVQAVTTPGEGPSGLMDVSINGFVAVATGAATIQPVPSAFSSSKCGVGAANVVDFVYRVTSAAF